MDKGLEILGWVFIFSFWLLTIVSYPSLPDSIPTHYNGAGEADAFGKKSSVFSLPIIATILFIGLTVLNKYPHLFNYPNKIHPENAREEYTKACRLIRFLKFSIVFIFELIAWQTIRTAKGETNGLGAWFLPVFIGLILFPLFYYAIQSSKSSKQKQ